MSNSIVAYISPGGRIFRCLDHRNDLSPSTRLIPVTESDLEEGRACTYPDCGRIVSKGGPMKSWGQNQAEFLIQMNKEANEYMAQERAHALEELRILIRSEIHAAFKAIQDKIKEEQLGYSYYDGYEVETTIVETTVLDILEKVFREHS